MFNLSGVFGVVTDLRDEKVPVMVGLSTWGHQFGFFFFLFFFISLDLILKGVQQ